MKHETVSTSLKRYERYPLSETERLCIGLVMVFFISMLLIFIFIPALLQAAVV